MELIRSCESIRRPKQEEISLPTQEEEEGEREENEKRDTDEAESLVRSKRILGTGKNYSVSGYHEKKLPEGLKEFLPSNGEPFFVTKLRKNRSNELSIPYEVRDDFGLKFSESIDLLDLEGRFWIGRINLWKDGRVWVKDGWKRLCKWNKVSMDDWIICEFLPSRKPTCEVIKVQIIHSKDLKRQTHN